ncbi:Mss4-like protein [Hypoxylon trugodes]|uniref:Mss4-like protein n=1 Tax=Hypoxylon trugodes TaxID=326681 RepID=UPI00218DA3AB|nr:Mss4-like protein [Hypoxylon trugodes]KAI1387670.1 Mss4-like protein [Hypoxylon trugodes]
MASTGSCFCSKVRISFEGEPIRQATCHCYDCRKISGSTYSTNLIVPGAGFKLLSGEPKAISKTADSGNTVTSHFCGDCGTTLWRDGPSFGENKVVKAGTLDDVKALDGLKPGFELFSDLRVGWVAELPDTVQKTAM